MSVINQMLRDLDKRQAADPALLRTPALTVAKKRHWYWALLLLLPALWWGFEIGQFGLKPAPAVVAPKPQVEPAATAATATPAATSAGPVDAAADKTPVAMAAAETDAPPIATTTVQNRPTQPAKLIPAEPSPQTAEQQDPEPVKTEIVAGSDAVTEAYALADSDAAFLAESETVGEPSAESQPSAPIVKPQMTISAADPQRVAQQQQRDLAAQQWANIQQLAGMQQWQALLDALTPALQQQYPQQVLALEAHAAQQTGQIERAQQAYQRWSQLMPQDSRPWLGLGTMLDQRGQWPEAQQAYQQALQLGGLSPASQQFIQQRLASANGQ